MMVAAGKGGYSFVAKAVSALLAVVCCAVSLGGCSDTPPADPTPTESSSSPSPTPSSDVPTEEPSDMASGDATPSAEDENAAIEEYASNLIAWLKTQNADFDPETSALDMLIGGWTVTAADNSVVYVAFNDTWVTEYASLDNLDDNLVEATYQVLPGCGVEDGFALSPDGTYPCYSLIFSIHQVVNNGQTSNGQGYDLWFLAPMDENTISVYSVTTGTEAQAVRLQQTGG